MVSYPHAKFKLKKIHLIKGVFFFNGAGDGILHELFNKEILPAFQTAEALRLFSQLDDYKLIA